MRKITKEEILDDINNYSKEQLDELLELGIITINDYDSINSSLNDKESDNLIISEQNSAHDAEDYNSNSESIAPVTLDKNLIDIENKEEENESIFKDEVIEPKVTLIEDEPPAMFSNSLLFTGRIRRLEYCLSIIIYYVLYVFGAWASVTLNSVFLFWIIFGLSLYFLSAQGCKRCHDIDYSGWWQLIPFFGFLLMFIDGNPEENGYGIPPKKQ